ncbi:hypothetical protein [Selenomonas sp. oral taxon 920]|uniref:hypothetical protein n=1 Tax=Selenomonas sp. oral taxon 920 TaxID=1884263 RepID=UPI001C1FA82B|nr:hypothetical protein [Selenomonas sp. oral taxon 920]
MKRIFFVVLLLVSLFAMGGCGEKQGERTYTKEHPLVFRMALSDGEATVYYKGAKEISDRVYEKTDGRIHILVVPGGALGASVRPWSWRWMTTWTLPHQPTR